MIKIRKKNIKQDMNLLENDRIIKGKIICEKIHVKLNIHEKDYII